MTEKCVLKEYLEQLDSSLIFLLIIIVSILLSFQATCIQRTQLRNLLEEDSSSTPSVFPIRYTASILIVGALGFFLCLAIQAWNRAEAGQDPAAKRSARVNALASALVLAAALLRLDELLFAESNNQTALSEEVLPAGI